VWGVLYKLTRRDLVRLDATEGIPWSRYRPLWLDAEDIDGSPLRAVAYIAQGNEMDGKPSLRYITLLRDSRGPMACLNITSVFLRALNTRTNRMHEWTQN
jgi:hypothetical protein